MSTAVLHAAVLAAGPDALRCLFTEAQPTRPVLLSNLAAGWPDADAATLGAALDTLLADGHLLPSITARDRYRLALDVLDTADNSNETATETPTTETQSVAKPSAPLLFSYYRGGITATIPYAAITLAQLFAVLTSDRHRVQTEALRSAPVGSSERTELKKGLDYVTLAGIFTRRANDALAVTSGLLVLDFDRVPDVPAARAALLADALLADGLLVLLFTSPSGNGLKAVVLTEPTGSHLDNFRAYAAYLTGKYAHLGLTPDEAGKDVARACFVPYAPNAWLAPAYAA